jgi:GTPase SAR1 family protein
MFAGGGKQALVGVWDCPGKPAFRPVTTRYIPGAHAVVICFDVTRTASWLDARQWVSASRQLLWAWVHAAVMLHNTAMPGSCC